MFANRRGTSVAVYVCMMRVSLPSQFSFFCGARRERGSGIVHVPNELE